MVAFWPQEKMHLQTPIGNGFLPERDYVMFQYMLLQIRLSVCRLSVKFPTQPVVIFGNGSNHFVP